MLRFYLDGGYIKPVIQCDNLIPNFHGCWKHHKQVRIYTATLARLSP